MDGSDSARWLARERTEITVSRMDVRLSVTPVGEFDRLDTYVWRAGWAERNPRGKAAFLDGDGLGARVVT